MKTKSIFQISFEIIVRVLLVTCIFTLLGFAIGLFCGIGVAVLAGLIRHVHPDMTMAYRFGAIPFAVVAFAVTFLMMLFNEIRRARNPLAFSGPFSLRRTS